MKTLVQCDFDGTITEEEVSSVLLDIFARGDWRQLLRQYREHRISVLELNTRSFAMVTADEAALLEALKDRFRVRAGFHGLVDCCLRKGFRLAIVSNGLDFYIRAVLKELGLEELEVHAARAGFHPHGMEVRYVGPDGRIVEDGFKEAYTRSFLEQGYGIVYLGNGESDVAPAKHAQLVFATDELLEYCRDNGVDCRPLVDFTAVVGELETL
ncbi:MAG: HAD-IB family phosphatase [Dehalococcoidia bacterium]